jgi:hypothetical protein
MRKIIPNRRRRPSKINGGSHAKPTEKALKEATRNKRRRPNKNDDEADGDQGKSTQAMSNTTQGLAKPTKNMGKNARGRPSRGDGKDQAKPPKKS